MSFEIFYDIYNMNLNPPERGVYQCKLCNQIKRSTFYPNLIGCQNSINHEWEKLSDSGTKTLICIKCLRVFHSFFPFKLEKCSKKVRHNLYLINLSNHNFRNNICSIYQRFELSNTFNNNFFNNKSITLIIN